MARWCHAFPRGVSPDFTERLLRRFLLLCENPRTRRRALALVQGEREQRPCRAAVLRAGQPGGAQPGRADDGRRDLGGAVELVGAQLIGLAMLRYVLKVEPIASLDIDELVPADGSAAAAGADRLSSVPTRSCACREELVAVPW